MIFGQIDSLKLKSCMTLFYLSSNENIFINILDKYFNGDSCNTTEQIAFPK